MLVGLLRRGADHGLPDAEAKTVRGIWLATRGPTTSRIGLRHSHPSSAVKRSSATALGEGIAENTRWTVGGQSTLAACGDNPHAIGRLHLFRS
jgi:hypothetical protein